MPGIHSPDKYPFMKRILITGGSGRLGSELVKHLPEPELNVQVLSSRPNVAMPPGVNVISADLTHIGSLQVLGDYDVVVHCASNPRDFKSVDLDGTENLLRVLRAKETGHVVYVSIVGVDKSENLYYKAKYEAEQMVMKSGLNWSILRATQFHDFVMDFFIRPFDKGGPTLQIPAGMKFQSIDLGDVASQLTRIILGLPTKSVQSMVGPEELSIERMAQLYVNALGLDSSVDPRPLDGEMYALFRSGENLAKGEMRGRITWVDFLKRRFGERLPG